MENTSNIEGGLVIDQGLGTIEFVIEMANRFGQWYTRGWWKRGFSWYDHRFDWARGPAYWMWMERGVLGHFYLRQNDRVLDLCCGDGLFTGLYFSKKASIVQGLDRDPAAVELATSLYRREGVEFFQRDILEDPFPLDEYDAVMWFQAIEHFEQEDCIKLIEKIKQHLCSGGFLFGSTILGHSTGNREHKIEFLVPEDLRELLEPHFDQVVIWTSEISKTRTELFFHCE